LQECSVKDDLIRDLEAERAAHCSALADLRSSTASLASTIEAVTRTLAPLAPGTRPLPHPSSLLCLCRFSQILTMVTSSLYHTRSLSSWRCSAATTIAATPARSVCRCCPGHFLPRLCRASDCRVAGRAQRHAFQGELCGAAHDGRGWCNGVAAQESGGAAGKAGG
jgi:hypothetical protein